ncbi:MAG: succinylglutamate desuccinylase/aspartoacylase family protein [Cyanobacteria bacterium J06621_8]
MSNILQEAKDFDLVSYVSDQPGLKVCIVGGVHGNEECGVEAVKFLRSEFDNGQKLLCGEILTLIANFKAVKSGKRSIDFDLNRSFRNSLAIGHEAQLAKKISTYLVGVDYLLDLHSTSAPTEPFGAGTNTQKHLEMFNFTGFKYYTHGWEIHRGHSMLIDEVDRLGGVGVILECGIHHDVKTNKNALDASLRLLQRLEMIEQSQVEAPEDIKVISIDKIVKVEKRNFNFTRKFENLDLIMANEVIATYENKSISFPYSFTMVMPSHAELNIGDEAFAVGTLN